MHRGGERAGAVVVVRRARQLGVQVPAVQVGDLDGRLDVALLLLAPDDGNALSDWTVIPQPPHHRWWLPCGHRRKIRRVEVRQVECCSISDMVNLKCYS